MKAYIPPKAKTLPFCAESLLAKSFDIDENEPVENSDKSNRRSVWDADI